MKAFHNSRDPQYRSPFGAVEAGTEVTLRIDVWDAPDAHVKLRTWVDGIGERLYPMEPLPSDDSSQQTGARGYRATLAPEQAGMVWYQFVIEEQQGGCWRYGALDGATGGEGRAEWWEPPSFLLSVFDGARSEAVPKGPGLAYRVAASGLLDGDEWLEQLDYLERLGVTDLIVDRLQGSAGFEQLADAARSRGMRIRCERPSVPSYMDALVSFVRNEKSAREVSEAIESARESSAPHVFEATVNLFTDESRARLLTRLGSEEPTEALPLDRWAGIRLDDGRRGLAKGRLWCSSVIQMLMPGIPAVCSGDEAGMEGSIDAEDAAAFPWGSQDRDCEAIIQNALGIRNTLPLLAQGAFSCFAVNDDVLGVWRLGDDGTAACMLVNSSLRHAYDIAVPMAGAAANEVIDGNGLSVLDEHEASRLSGKAARAPLPGASRPELESSYAGVHLNQLGTALLFFHDSMRLEEAMEPGFGVLAHITSLPATKGRRSCPGTIGKPALDFVDWLAEAGVRYWQVLPINPTDEHGSPYAGISAFACNVRLLDEPVPVASELAADEAYRSYCERESDWLRPYACFMAIREHLGSDAPWQDWPEKYRRYDPNVVEDDPVLRDLAEAHCRSQFVFEKRWQHLRARANERGIGIIGDMPIYVSADSADVWANQEIFQLGPDGEPRVVAGCPPDAFAADGQVWGNPVYDWDTLKADGYAWWLRRLERAFELYDFVRLDHFIGFCRYFSIPAGQKATAGTYRPGPGIDLFQKAQEDFGQLPIIAEDLGMITPAVRLLDAACGFPGMDIVQFVNGNDPLSGYQPRPEKIAYTGTHDNQTIVGYAKERYSGKDPIAVADELIEKVVSSSAPVCILPLQDLMGLDDSARMNVPGVAEGNWIWQAKRRDMGKAQEKARELVALYRASHAGRAC